MEKYLEAILSPLLLEPQELKITRSDDEMGVLLTVGIAQPDMGRVIGKAGETIKAIRLLMHIFGAQQKARVSLKVLEPGRI